MKKGFVLLAIGGIVGGIYGIIQLIRSVPFLDLLVWTFIGISLAGLSILTIAIMKNKKGASH